MRERRRRASQPRPEMPIAPMIDCVFLMLVYFMTTSSLERSETEQSLPLQRGMATVDALPAVDEQQLHLGVNFVLWNGTRFPIAPGPENWMDLLERLKNFKRSCQYAGTEPSIQVLPEDTATQQDLVTLLDAIQRAGIESMHLP